MEGEYRGDESDQPATGSGQKSRPKPGVNTEAAIPGRRCARGTWIGSGGIDHRATGSSDHIPTQTPMSTRLFALAALAFLALPAVAQTATQNVTIVVPEVELISVNDAAKTITFTTPTAGNNFADATASSSYNLTVNTTNNKITGALSAAYATGITLKATLGAPTGASSAGAVTLGTTAVNLVTGVGTVAQTGLAIGYTASATAAAGPNGPGETRTVTFTITDQ